MAGASSGGPARGVACSDAERRAVGAATEPPRRAAMAVPLAAAAAVPAEIAARARDVIDYTLGPEGRRDAADADADADADGDAVAAADAAASGVRSGRLKPKVITFDDGWSFGDDEPPSQPRRSAEAESALVDGPYTNPRDRAAHEQRERERQVREQRQAAEAFALAEAEAAVAAEAAEHAQARAAQAAAAQPEALALPASPAEVLLTNGYFLRVAIDADEGEPLQEDRHADGKLERAYRSGRVQILYPTGTRKEVLPNGVQTVIFSNGDVKQTGVDKRVVYYYAEAATTHVSEPNGTQLYHFPNGQIERHFSDGLKEIKFADGTLKIILPSGEVQSLTEMPFAPRAAIGR